MKNKQQLSYTEYENRIDSLRKSEKISAESIGKSIMGRHIQKLEIGLGEKKILLLGGVCGDSESADTLLSFAEEFKSFFPSSFVEVLAPAKTMRYHWKLGFLV